MENEWQPAIILSLEHSCEYHRKIFDIAPERVKQERRNHIGKKIEVQATQKIITMSNTIVENKKCLPLVMRRLDSQGCWKYGGLFSCEVLTD